jgi:uncharacterized delta-60 repeat protein
VEHLEDRTVPSAGMLDPTFGTDSGGAFDGSGKVIMNSSLSNRDFGDAVALQADGKIIVAESALTPARTWDLDAIRYNSDGTVDTSFGPSHNGFVSFAGWGGAGGGVAVLPDGKILLAAGLGGDLAAVRLNSDGTVDTNFGDSGTGVQLIGFTNATGGVINVGFIGMAIQPAGSTDYRIVLGGDNWGNSGAVARLTSDGRFDNSFKGDGKLLLPDAPNLSLLAVQSDKILLEDIEPPSFSGRLTRLNNDGSVDTTFVGTSVQPTFTTTMTVQTDGKIVLAGQGGQYNTDSTIGVERLNPDGGLDTTFGAGGQTTVDFSNDFDLSRLDPYANPDVIRVEQSGLPTRAWYTVGAAVNAVAMQPDGKLVLAGNAGPELQIAVDRGDGVFRVLEIASYVHSAVARLNSDGSLDTTYGSGGKQIIDFGGGEDPGGGEGYYAAAIQPDGNAVPTGFTPHAPGYAVLTARYLGGAMNVTTQAAVAGQLDQVIATANLSGQSDAVTFQASSQADVDTMLAAVNALPTATTDVTVTLDLGGGTYSTGGVAVNPPAHVNFVIQNGTLDPSSPALTVAGGNVTVQNCTLVTTGDAPTILVTGGHLMLRNDAIEESTGGNDAAIAITGGTVDLGTTADPGNNVIVINGPGVAIQNSAGSVVPAVGDTILTVLSDLSLARQAGSTIPIQIELLNASGQDISSAATTITALDVTSGSSSFAAVAAGNSNPGDVFQYVGGTQPYYQFNLQTKNLAGAGTYTLRFTVQEDPIAHSLEFALK